MIETLAQALKAREHRIAKKQYEKDLARYHEQNLSVAQGVVNDLLAEIARGDAKEYILIVDQKLVSFAEASVVFNHQNVFRAVLWPEKPQFPADAVDSNDDCKQSCYFDESPVWDKLPGLLADFMPEAKIRDLRFGEHIVFFITIPDSVLLITDEEDDEDCFSPAYNDEDDDPAWETNG